MSIDWDSNTSTFNSRAPLVFSEFLNTISQDAALETHPQPQPEAAVPALASLATSLSGLSAMPPPNPVSSLPTPAAATPERAKGKRGELPKPVTDYLKDWLLRHSDHPYPSEDEKKQLCQVTGLSMSQVTNWMINVCQFLPRFVPNGRFTLLPQARRRILAPAQRAQANAAGSSSAFRTPSSSDPLLSDPSLNPHYRHHPSPQQHLHPSS